MVQFKRKKHLLSRHGFVQVVAFRRPGTRAGCVLLCLWYQESWENPAASQSEGGVGIHLWSATLMSCMLAALGLHTELTNFYVKFTCGGLLICHSAKRCLTLFPVVLYPTVDAGRSSLKLSKLLIPRWWNAGREKVRDRCLSLFYLIYFGLNLISILNF